MEHIFVKRTIGILPIFKERTFYAVHLIFEI